MEHYMKLCKAPFEMVRSEKKKIEVRLYDEKRQALHLGDTIVFSKLPDLQEQIRVKVSGLLRYSTFSDLLSDLPLEHFGYFLDGVISAIDSDENRKKVAESMYAYYTKEEERKYGVLGIRITMLPE